MPDDRDADRPGLLQRLLGKSPAVLHGLVDRLKGLGAGLGLVRPPAPAADVEPVGSRFIDGTFTDTAGSRNYKLFIPRGYDGQAVPLLVMLHGCTQSPDDFAAGTRMNALAETHACLVVYPSSRPRPTRRNAGTGSCPTTRSAGAASRR